MCYTREQKKVKNPLGGLPSGRLLFSSTTPSADDVVGGQVGCRKRRIGQFLGSKLPYQGIQRPRGIQLPPIRVCKHDAG